MDNDVYNAILSNVSAGWQHSRIFGYLACSFIELCSKQLYKISGESFRLFHKSFIRKVNRNYLKNEIVGVSDFTARDTRGLYYVFTKYKNVQSFEGNYAHMAFNGIEESRFLSNLEGLWKE